MYKKIILSIGLIALLGNNAPVKACGANPSAIPQILATMCHMCVFPLSIAGIQAVQGNMPDPSHMVGSPVCICTDPFPRVGIPVGFFEPSSALLNIPSIQDASYSSAFLNSIRDENGRSISMPMIMKYKDQLLPSLPLEIVRTIYEYIISDNHRVKVRYIIDGAILFGIRELFVGWVMLKTNYI